jgi:pimeloyl-ACP methyl ester carboxylesterase
MNRFEAGRHGFSLILCLCIYTLPGCFSGDLEPHDAVTKCVENESCVTILGTGTYIALDRAWPYQLLRLGSPDGSFVYAQWLPPPAGTRGPAVLMANPYDGIDWSGEDVDRRWSKNSGTPGCYDDVDAPAFKAGISIQTCYGGTLSPDKTAEQAIAFLLNDVGVLIVFGRFYAGGSATTYIQTAVTGLEYLSVNPGVDQSHVGVFGVSLGGFMALHGAARAPAGIPAPIGVGISPLLDFEAQSTYVEEFLPNQLLPSQPTVLAGYRDFFEPYLRRAYAVSGGPPGPSTDFSAINLGPLRSGLNGAYLVIHDEWDTLVPAAQAHKLDEASLSVEGFWYPHTSAIDFVSFGRDHQQPSEGQTYSVSRAFGDAFLLSRLTDSKATVLLLYDWNEFSRFMAYIRIQQSKGTPIDWLVPRLIEFANARFYAVDVSTAHVGSAPGYHVVGLLLNAIWGANLDEASFSSSVLGYLQTRGLN